MQYELRNERGDRVLLDGNRIAHINTDDGNKLRWIELSVFERDAGGFAYHTVGKSVVFHSLEPESPCTAGSPAKTADLDFTTLERCTRCNPQTDPNSGVVLLEDELHTLVLKDSFEDMVQAMRVPGKGFTGPVRQLLVQLSRGRAETVVRL